MRRSYCRSRHRFSRAPSGAPSSFRLNVSWALGLKGTNGETLEGSFSGTGRTAASNRTMKISASIATTLGSRQANTQRAYATSFIIL